MAEGSRGRRSVSHVRGWLFAAAGFALAFVGGLPADAKDVGLRAAGRPGQPDRVRPCAVRAWLAARRISPQSCAMRPFFPGGEPVDA